MIHFQGVSPTNPEASVDDFRTSINQLYDDFVVKGMWLDPTTLQTEKAPHRLWRRITNIWQHQKAYFGRRHTEHPMSRADRTFSSYLSLNRDHFKKLLKVDGHTVEFFVELQKIYAISASLARKGLNGYLHKFMYWIPSENSGVMATYLLNTRLKLDDNAPIRKELNPIFKHFKENKNRAWTFSKIQATIL